MRKFSFILLFFSFSLIALSQVSLAGRDTLSLSDIRKINKVFCENSYLKKERDYMKDIKLQDSIKIDIQDLKIEKLQDIVVSQEDKYKIQEEFIKVKQEEWEKNLRKTKRRNLIIGGTSGIILGFLTGILIK